MNTHAHAGRTRWAGRSRTHLCRASAVALAVALAAHDLRGDTIVFGLPLEDVTVLQIQGGEVVFVRQGVRLSRSLESVEAIYFDDLPLVREAEARRGAGDLTAAVQRYAEALQAATSDMQRLWLHSRLARGHGEAGKPAQAVAALAHVGQFDPDSFWLLLVPDVRKMSASPAELAAARAVIDDVRGAEPTTEVRRFLDTLESVLAQIPVDEAPAAETAGAQAAAEKPADADFTPRFTQVQAHVAAGEAHQALALITRLSQQASRAELAELYFHSGEALRLLDEPALAGLAYARCAAHFPDSPWTACSYLALARLYESAFDKPRLALRLARRAQQAATTLQADALRAESESFIAHLSTRTEDDPL